jgi:hypothetical protein
MKPARIILLVIAVAVGGIAALLVGRSNPHPPAPAPTSLTAASNIGFGIGGVEMVRFGVLTAWSGAAPSEEIVNRTRKGDRLPLIPTFHRNTMSRPLEINVSRTSAHDQELAEGCESLASSLAQSPLAHVAGRCLS